MSASLPFGQLRELPVTSDAAADIAGALRRVLEWKNPLGTIETRYLPPWLAEQARAALARFDSADRFEPTRWWRIVALDGELLCETSDEEEARYYAKEEGRSLQRMYKEREVTEWREEP